MELESELISITESSSNRRSDRSNRCGVYGDRKGSGGTQTGNACVRILRRDRDRGSNWSGACVNSLECPYVAGTGRCQTNGCIVIRPIMNENDDFVGAGVWYRTGDAISPHIFLEYRKLLIGFSYDVAVNRLESGASAAQSMEVSLLWRLDRE